MDTYVNPFEYEAASKLKEEELLKYYIEDYTYSRFIHSRRNVFLVGERGTGKTMALRYHSFLIQKKKAEKENIDPDLSIISVYVPCNTPLTHRREFEVLDKLQASLSSEHFLVVSIMNSVVETMSDIDSMFMSEEKNKLRAELNYELNLDLPEGVPLFLAISLALNRANIGVQETLNCNLQDASLTGLLSFSSGLRPLLECLRRIPELARSHFSLMIDDVQLLNEYQIRALNSWIAYRDNSLFSFKLTSTRVEIPSMETASGGNILEGHDFSRIDMEQPYQNKMSEFGKMAKQIITRRLYTMGIASPPEEFFPVHPQFDKDMKKATEKVMKEAKRKYPDGPQKQITDYIYKHARAQYFRDRAKHANLPPYSGFELLVHLSTGVIRNLLDPCYWMYEQIYSELHSKGGIEKIIITMIPAETQNRVIQERSKKKWEWMRDELDNTIEGCSREDAKRVYRLLDNLAVLFNKRLMEDISEPRAVVFTISNQKESIRENLDRILLLAQKAQLLYTYTSSAKEVARREKYYMPNRILWPDRGLDPIGQHARVSIQAQHLWNATEDNTPIPFGKDDQEHEPELFPRKE